MIFDMSLKYIREDENDDEKLYFYGHDKATKEEKRRLKNLDDVHFKINKEHIITNYKDLLE